MSKLWSHSPDSEDNHQVLNHQVLNHQVLKIGFPAFGDIPLQNLVDEHFSQKITEQENGRRCTNCGKHNDSVEHDKRVCKPKPSSTKEYVTRHP